jgi:hypothetical protein
LLDAEKQKASDADQQEDSDVDAEADEWDDAEYERQMRIVWTRMYSAKHTNEVRDECKKRNLRIWGHKHLCVKRIVDYEIRLYMAGDGGRAPGGEDAPGGEYAPGGEEAHGVEETPGGEEAPGVEEKPGGK